MLIKDLFKILLALCLCFPAFSQKKLFEKHYDIAFGVGTANYYGDIVPINRSIQSTTENLRWNISVDLTRHFTPRFSGSIALTWVRIAGDDSKLEGVPLLEKSFMRNIHFRNDIQELSFKGIFNLIKETNRYQKREQVIPYVFLGFAFFHHNPIAKVPLGYNGSDASPGEWVSLQPLHTEGQGLQGNLNSRYELFALNFPLGFGLKYKIDRKFDLGFEAGIRYNLTDYIDDVGGLYANFKQMYAISPLSAIMGHREYELIAANTGNNREASIRKYLSENVNPIYSNPNLTPVSSFPEIFKQGTIRDGASKLNDVYLLTSFRLVYHLSPKIKCPIIQ